MSEAADITSYRLDRIEATLSNIAETLERLAALEQKHLETRDAVGRAFDAIGGHEGRLRSAELELETLKLVRSWVISGVLGIVGLLAVAVWNTFIKG